MQDSHQRLGTGRLYAHQTKERFQSLQGWGLFRAVSHVSSIYLFRFVFFTCFLFLKMSILICPVAVAQFMAVVYLCFETLSIITPTHPMLMTRIRCHFQGPLMVIVSRALKTIYTSAGISFVLQDSVGMNASDTVTVCVPVGFSLLSCCRTGKTFRWS